MARHYLSVAAKATDAFGTHPFMAGRTTGAETLHFIDSRPASLEVDRVREVLIMKTIPPIMCVVSAAKLMTTGAAVVAILGAGFDVLNAQTITPAGKIAFVSAGCVSTAGRPCLALIDPDGTNLVELTSTEASEPVWSPDGARLAYTNAAGLFVIPAAGGTPTSLVASTNASSPSWSPDGTRIVLANMGLIQVLPSSGGQFISLTTSESGNTNPAWSPKAERIAFLSNRDHDWWISELYAMNADGSGIARLAPGVPAMGRPAWSLDGSHIVFTCQPASQVSVCVVGADGSGFAVVANDGGVDNSPIDATMPSWSSQMKIAYSANTGSDPYCGYRLSVVNVVGGDGSGLTQLGAGAGTTGSSVRTPVWSPPGDRIAFTNWDINSWEEWPYCPEGGACNGVVYTYCFASPSVYVMNSDGTNKVPLATGYDDAWQPASAGGPPLVAAFTHACSDVACTFDASSSQGAASYAWSFGDGATGSGPLTTHTYGTGDASYNVTLTARSASGNRAVMSQPVVPTPPVASFTFSCSGLICTFDASSSHQSITTYAWTFGDGTSGSGQVATHTYAAGAQYHVTLTVFTVGALKALTSHSVTPNSPPAASFTVGCASLTCTFDASASRDLDGTIAAYAWSFGDGDTASATNSTHTYRAAGTYLVTLIVTDNRGAAGEQRQNVSVKRQPVRR
jgi:Tol biopolymer transport system component/chitodextrinase